MRVMIMADNKKILLADDDAPDLGAEAVEDFGLFFDGGWVHGCGSFPSFDARGFYSKRPPDANPASVRGARVSR